MLVPTGYEDEIKSHKELFSGPSLELGKIHWYIQKADTEMTQRCFVRKEGEQRVFNKLKRTAFGDEVGGDEINWWVFKRETEIEELKRRTETTLDSAQKLKEDSFSLKEKDAPKSYPVLIRVIGDFAEDHKKEIRDLHEYVLWLHKKDVLAPRILFTYRVWGTTRRSDRMISISAKTLDEDHHTVQECVETACGLRIGGTYTVGDIYRDARDEIMESIDDEYQGPISVPKHRVISRTSYKVRDELATYFEFLRKSLRNIILEIEKYNDQMNLLYKESFWRSFILKAMSISRIENLLWDFKATLEMWHPRHREKERAEFEFCEQVASFANTKGGVLIVGVTDGPPRRIVGVQDLENKLRSTKGVLRRHCKYDTDFTHFQQVVIENSAGENQICLVIVIAQTKSAVSVKDQSGKFSCPIRLETGLQRSDCDRIDESKKGVTRDNYHFIQDLHTFLHDR